jgi:hypothetical protein
MGEDLDLERVGAHEPLGEPEVELAGEDELLHARRVPDLELQTDVRMRRVELPEDRRHDIAADGSAGGHRQMTRFETHQRLERRLRRLLFLKQSARVAAQDLPRRGQPNPPRAPLNQGHP